MVAVVAPRDVSRARGFYFFEIGMTWAIVPIILDMFGQCNYFRSFLLDFSCNSCCNQLYLLTLHKNYKSWITLSLLPLNLILHNG